MNETEKRALYWKTDAYFDAETRAEIAAVTDEKELFDRFYRDLEFGTAGMRGVMGAGSNRMNKYIIRKATYGFCRYLKEKYGEEVKRGVVIAYDTRNHSEEYARETALMLCAEKIPAYLFREVSPVPLLSFTVRHLGCVGGVAVTASHNPKEYNGYKVYDETGCQLTPKDAEEVIRYVDAVTDLSILRPAEDGGEYLHMLGDEAVKAFCEAVLRQSHELSEEEIGGLKVAYTPLHGSGNKPVRYVLGKRGFDVTVVTEQEAPDGDFPTVRAPNPEDKEALTCGIELAKKIGADIVLGTDPDCDRVGIAVKNGGAYELLTGNQVGALLVDYITERRKASLDSRCTVIKTIVTSDLGGEIARSRGLCVKDVLTGFKYIGELITSFEKTGETFTIGYEESYGYLVGTHARDKDGVVASMLICEMAAYHKARGRTLSDVLNGLYETYGYYLDTLDSYTLRGADGAERIKEIMRVMRERGKAAVAGTAEALDYREGLCGLPKADVLKLMLDDGSSVTVRPSGTEPKIKVYYSIRRKNRAEAEARLCAIKKEIAEYIK